MQLVMLASLAPDRLSPRVARRVVRDLLDGVDHDVVDGVVLAVSELATNAVLHAETQFEIYAGVERDRIRIEVHDADPTLPERRNPQPDDLGGRGLLLVDSVADRWGVEPDEDGKTIWFERALHGSRELV